MDIEQFSPRMLRLFVWIGPLFVVISMIGLVMSGFIPPGMSPEDSAEEVAEFYSDDKTAIRIGMVLLFIGYAIFGAWGAVIAMFARREEKGFPAITYIQLVSLAASVALICLIPLTWAAAAYRPDDIDPDITRMLNDVGWFLFLFTWAPFSVWTAAVGLGIIRDKRPQPTFPRWSAYLSFWTAFLYIPASLMAFFKSGPLAYDGVIALWIPLIIFLIWIIGMTVAMLNHISRLERELPLEQRELAHA